jgi:hypothetical protein
VLAAFDVVYWVELARDALPYGQIHRRSFLTISSIGKLLLPLDVERTGQCQKTWLYFCG